jgi:endophilin-A
MGGMSMGMGKRKSGKFGGYDDGERAALQSDEEDDEYSYRSSSPRASGFSATGRTRSTSTLSVSHISIGSDNTSTAPAPTRPSGMRRTYTSPSSLNARYVKALYPFAGEAADELALRPGQVVEIKHEVSDDWWVGESEGRSGMFPSAYVEEYVPRLRPPCHHGGRCHRVPAKRVKRVMAANPVLSATTHNRLAATMSLPLRRLRWTII